MKKVYVPTTIHAYGSLSDAIKTGYNGFQWDMYTNRRRKDIP